MYSIQITTFGFPEAIRKIEKVLDIVDNQRDDIALAALHGTAAVFEQNFKSEGRLTGTPWPSLRERTQLERIALGFDPDHPILVRYGSLQYATSTFLATASKTATFYSADPEGKAIGITLTTGKDDISVLAYGEKAANQVGGGTTNVPARQFWFVTNRVMQAAKDSAVDWLADAIKRA